MSNLKTRPTTASVQAFLEAISDAERRRDCLELTQLMTRATGSEPKLWGPGIVGFGQYHYKYESGREGDWFLTGFASRKSALTIYIMDGFEGHDSIMSRLGRYKTGKSCLYIKRLADVDRGALDELVRESVRHVSKVHSA